MGVGAQHYAPADFPPPPPQRLGTNYAGGSVGLRAGVDGYAESRPCRDSIPRLSSP